jgi:hypothetical protein
VKNSKVVLGFRSSDMTSEGLREMFEGDSADTCAGKFPLVSMGADRKVLHAQTQERGPPAVLAEILVVVVFLPPLLKSQKVLS